MEIEKTFKRRMLYLSAIPAATLILIACGSQESV